MRNALEVVDRHATPLDTGQFDAMVRLIRVDVAFEEFNLRCRTRATKGIHDGFPTVQIHLDCPMIAVEVAIKCDARTCREMMRPVPARMPQSRTIEN